MANFFPNFFFYCAVYAFYGLDTEQEPEPSKIVTGYGSALDVVTGSWSPVYWKYYKENLRWKIETFFLSQTSESWKVMYNTCIVAFLCQFWGVFSTVSFQIQQF